MTSLRILWWAFTDQWSSRIQPARCASSIAMSKHRSSDMTMTSLSGYHRHLKNGCAILMSKSGMRLLLQTSHIISISGFLEDARVTRYSVYSVCNDHHTIIIHQIIRHLNLKQNENKKTILSTLLLDSTHQAHQVGSWIPGHGSCLELSFVNIRVVLAIFSKLYTFPILSTIVQNNQVPAIGPISVIPQQTTPNDKSIEFLSSSISLSHLFPLKPCNLGGRSIFGLLHRSCAFALADGMQHA